MPDASPSRNDDTSKVLRRAAYWLDDFAKGIAHAYKKPNGKGWDGSEQKRTHDKLKALAKQCREQAKVCSECGERGRMHVGTFRSGTLMSEATKRNLRAPKQNSAQRIRDHLTMHPDAPDDAIAECRLGDLRALACAGSETAAVSADELKRLRDIEHYVWHVLDDSEEDATTGTISIQPSDDYFKLSELLPEGHP